MVRAALLGFLTLCLAGTTLASQEKEKFNFKVAIGDPAPVYADLPGVDGKKHSFADLRAKEVVVIVFTSNDCIVSIKYEDRLIQFAKKYAGPESKVAVVAINVSNEEEDRLPKMIERARKKGFNFAYLHDESQNSGRAYGATVTPGFFVLNKQRKIVYMGALDDHIDAKKARTNYVEDAVQATLQGKMPAVTETRGRGCSILYEEKK